MPVLQEIHEGHFVRTRVHSVLGAAKSLLHRAEESNVSVVRFGLAAFEKSTSWLSRPLVSQISKYGPPVIDSIDRGVTTAFSSAQKGVSQVETATTNVKQLVADRTTNVKQLVVGSAWLKTVDQLLQRVPKPVDFKAFFDAGVATFNKLEHKDFPQFLSQLKSTLKDTWDEKLTTPAREFYARLTAEQPQDPTDTDAPSPRRASARLHHLQTTLLQVWETNFVTVNARALYNGALDYYLSLRKDEAAVSPAELIDGMRRHLGAQWNDKLAQPLTEFFASANQFSRDQLQRLSLNVSDWKEQVPTASQHVLTSGRDAVSSARSFVQQRWVSLLDFSQSTLDTVLPADDDEEHDDVCRPPAAATQHATVSSLGHCATRRLRANASRRWSAIRELSTNKLAPILKVDVALAVENTVVPLYSATTTGVTTVIQRARSIALDARGAVHDAAAPAVSRLTNFYNTNPTVAAAREATHNARQSLTATLTNLYTNHFQRALALLSCSNSSSSSSSCCSSSSSTCDVPQTEEESETVPRLLSESHLDTADESQQ